MTTMRTQIAPLERKTRTKNEMREAVTFLNRIPMAYRPQGFGLAACTWLVDSKGDSGL